MLSHDTLDLKQPARMLPYEIEFRYEKTAKYLLAFCLVTNIFAFIIF